MTDVEAATRLQTILLSACEGNQDLSLGRDYGNVRRALLKRQDLYDVTPAIVRANRDLTSFWTYIKSVAAQWEPRRRHVYEQFQPLLDRVEGLTRAPSQSSNWTGRKKRTAEQQARVVLALGYDALAGIEKLQGDLDGRHHNGGPFDPEEVEAMEALKRLHLELGELIRLAELDQPLDDALARVKSSSVKAFQWSKSPIGFSLSSLPLTGFSTALGVGVMHLVNAIAPGVNGAGAAIGAGAMGVHVAAAAIGRKRSTAA